MRTRLACSVVGALFAGLLAGVPAMAAPMRSDDAPPALPPSEPGRIAYAIGDYHSSGGGAGISVRGLGAIGLDGTDQRALTDPRPTPGESYVGYDHTPQWSPDGNWLVYLQNRPRTGPEGGTVDSVMAIPRDGGDPQVIDPDGWAGTWSPDGQHLAWVSGDDGGRTIMVANVQTTETAIEVTNRRAIPLPDPTLRVAAPVFSPDGQTLAFLTGPDISNNAILYSVSLNGDDLRQLSTGVGVELSDTRHAFSPDGTKLLFVGMDQANRGTIWAYVVNADGTDQHRLSAAPTESAAWSPAGDTIALGAGVAHGIVFVTPAGEVVSSVSPGYRFDGLTYSPDGTCVFSVAAPAGTTAWEPDLYAFPVNGDDAQRLTFDHSVFPHTLQAIDPGSVLRQFGDGSVETAAMTATDSLGSADAIVVAPAADYAAALAAAPMAASLNAPVLVTGPDRLSPAVLRAATELNASRAVLVGGLSPAVEASLVEAGLDVDRVGDTPSPYGVAAAIASEVPGHRAIVVPIAAGEADAWRLPLASAGFAASQRQPLLFAKPGSLPPGTRTVLQQAGVTSVTVVGGDDRVGPRLLRQLEELGVTVHRLRSSDPFEVSARLAGRAEARGARTDHPVVSSGANWRSSVTAPALSAILGQLHVLVSGHTLAASKPTAAWLGGHRADIATVRLVGGAPAVHPLVEVQLERRVGR